MDRCAGVQVENVKKKKQSLHCERMFIELRWGQDEPKKVTSSINRMHQLMNPRSADNLESHYGLSTPRAKMNWSAPNLKSNKNRWADISSSQAMKFTLRAHLVLSQLSTELSAAERSIHSIFRTWTPPGKMKHWPTQVVQDPEGTFKTKPQAQPDRANTEACFLLICHTKFQPDSQPMLSLSILSRQPWNNKQLVQTLQLRFKTGEPELLYLLPI